MSSHLHVRSTGWFPSRDLHTAVRLCRLFNKGRFYEIFGEYCGLTCDVLFEKHACCWLYHENGVIRGFALGRRKQGALRMHGAFIFEELWGPCDGVTTELGCSNEHDIERVNRFKELIESLEENFIILRAAVDNPFAHLVARSLNAHWINGLVLAEKRLKGKIKLSALNGFRLRMFKNGDGNHMARIHKEVFGQYSHPKSYKDWARDTKRSAHNTIKEDKQLIEAGFEYVTERDGFKIYTKRK